MGLVVLTLLAAVPSQTDFDSTYFRTNALPVTIVGPLTNWAKLSTNAAGGSAVWTNIASGLGNVGSFLTPLDPNPSITWTTNHTGLNYRGNSLIFFAVSPMQSLSTLAQIASTNDDIFAIGGGAMNFDGIGGSITGSHDILALGDDVFGSATIINSLDLTAIADDAFYDAKIDTCNDLFAAGNSVFLSAKITNSANFFGAGHYVMAGSTIINSQDFLALGNKGLYSATTTNASDVTSIGFEAFSQAALTNSTGAMAIGYQAGKGDSGSLNLAFALGPKAHVTNNYDFTFGFSSNNYFFPGASARFDNNVTGVSGFSSTATDAVIAFTSTGITNSLGKVGVARFDGTTITYVVKNNANTPVYTNTVSVGHATEIIQSGGAIVITAGSGVAGTVSPF